jgi:hypothetical protein
MISIPTATHCPLFEWQLDLFWFCHRSVYGRDAWRRAHAVVAKRNEPREPKSQRLAYPIGVPHTMCEAFFDIPIMPFSKVALPINIQVGLAQLLPMLDDDAVIEVIDCDMFHFRAPQAPHVRDDQLLACTVYEDWHLHSKTENREVISRYFQTNGQYYNGGFVPIMGNVRTFKKILGEWLAIHVDILRRALGGSIHWWAGMFALQAACEKARVRMVSHDCCYIPGANDLAPWHHIGHYSIDRIFDKNTFPAIDRARFDLRNPYYRLIDRWLDARSK